MVYGEKNKKGEVKFSDEFFSFQLYQLINKFSSSKISNDILKEIICFNHLFVVFYFILKKRCS